MLDVEAPKPEPTTEILFLCSYDNCGKTFVDVSALRKHAHVHNEKQYICTEPNCGKVSPPGSQLERALVPHTYCLLLWYALEPCCTYLLSNTKHLEMFLFNWICLPLPIPYTEYFYHSGCTCPVFILSSWAVLLFIIVLFFLRLLLNCITTNGKVNHNWIWWYLSYYEALNKNYTFNFSALLLCLVLITYKPHVRYYVCRELSNCHCRP